MKYKFALLLLLTICACNTAPKTGALVAPPDGLEQAVKEHIQKDSKTKVRGISVRAYPQDMFLADVEVDTLKPPVMNGNAVQTNAEMTSDIRHYVVQKGYKDGAPYWQVRNISFKEAERLRKDIQ